MNETLENLLYCSGLTAQGGWDQLDQYQRDCVVKLVELTVCECVTILMKPEWVMNNRKALGEYNSGWVSGRWLAIEHIKQHFEAKDA